MTAPTATASGSDYAALTKKVRAAGLMERRRVAYGVRIGLTVAALAATWVAVALVGDSWYQTIVAVVMGLVSTQVVFLGHDGGHQQVFAKRKNNDVLGRVTGNLLTGLSYGWWVDKHNRHHANPNKEHHDPDIGDGVLAFTTEQIATRTGGLGRVIARRQAWLFFPLLTLEGLNLHAASIRSLLPGAERSRRGGSRQSEIALMSVHAVLFFGGLLLVMSPVKALVFFFIQKAAWGFYLGCSFAPNHKGMTVIGADEDVDYLRRQVLTSRNVRGGLMTDFLLGGLNYQIEHHLFPSMPRCSLRHAQRIVQEHCADLGIPYAETSMVESYVIALRYLNDLGAPLRPAKVVPVAA